jgi:hypothetical protein
MLPLWPFVLKVYIFELFFLSNNVACLIVY